MQQGYRPRQSPTHCVESRSPRRRRSASRKVATDLGYEANPIARALASGRTGMVGILGPRSRTSGTSGSSPRPGRGAVDAERFALILDAGGEPARSERSRPSSVTSRSMA